MDEQNGEQNDPDIDEDFFGEVIPDLSLEHTGDGFIKVDFDTSLERFYWIVGLLGVVFTLFVGIITLVDVKWDTVVEYWYLFSIPPFTIVFSYLAGKNTDNYYLLDLYKGKILFSRNIFFYHKKSLVAQFSDIFAVTLQGKVESDKYESWWEYFGVVVLRNGNLIRISDSSTDELLSVNEPLIKGLAKALDANYIEPVLETTIKIKTKSVTSESDFIRVTKYVSGKA